MIYYHVKVTGEIVTSDRPYALGSSIDFPNAGDRYFFVINCPDRELARVCLEEFLKAKEKWKFKEIE